MSSLLAQVVLGSDVSEIYNNTTVILLNNKTEVFKQNSVNPNQTAPSENVYS